MDLTNPITLGLCGIGFLAVVFFVVGLIQAAGSPNIDGDFSHIPANVAEKLVSLSNEVAKASLFHELIGKVFGWLSHAEVPHVNPDQRQGGLVMGIITVMTCGILIFAGAASGFFGKIVNLFPKDLLVQAGQTCTGIRNGQLVLLPEGSKLIVGEDACDGAIVQVENQVPTQISTQIAVSTSTMAPAVYTPTSPTVTPTQKPETFVILPIMFDGQITSQYRFQETTSLGGHHILAEAKCTLSDGLRFEIPLGTKTAFILFEGNRGEGMFYVPGTLINASQNTQFGISGNTFSVSLCTPPGSWFSLWVND